MFKMLISKTQCIGWWKEKIYMKAFHGRRHSYFPINCIANKIREKSNKKQTRLGKPKWFLNEIIFPKLFHEVSAALQPPACWKSSL